ncbi:MAG: hypothetical protein LBB45_01080 [Methanobrevibacter sp.]|jgi:predicted ATP-dependent Lon-type protease|nr:hypothetical protein [Candidatus Methanovirga basalitermitum]
MISRTDKFIVNGIGSKKENKEAVDTAFNYFKSIVQILVLEYLLKIMII